MYGTNVEFQIVSFLVYGLLFGGISSNLFFILLYCIFYEYFIFHISMFFPPKVKSLERVLLNLIFILGWVLGRYLMLNQSGFEDIIEYFN